MEAEEIIGGTAGMRVNACRLSARDKKTRRLRMSAKDWEKEVAEFKAKTDAYYAGEMTKGDYKGFSGFYGSYAQRDGSRSMLRLRMPAGCVNKEKMAFVAASVRKYNIERVHFTTCQTIQLHDLAKDTVAALVEEALDAGIVTMGGGGDYPRNVMCSPLSGVEPGEFFDVLPWAQAAGEYLLQFIRAEKMPRKLKVGFSNSARNLTHATYRDLGFTAREDGNFDVYSAGGLGNNPRFGVKVAECVPPEKILYYIKAMWLTFREHGNYQNRGKARTRYMQDSLGGPEEYKKAYLANLSRVIESGENLDISAEAHIITKQGEGNVPDDRRIIQQKQEGLYAVVWHPLGGQPSPDSLLALDDAIQGMDEVELRLAPDESVYIINLTAKEAGKILEITGDSASTLFESSVSCIGASICQVGLRDSQELLRNCVDAVRKADIPDGALPQIHISGCLSSCGTHQTGAMGFRGIVKPVDGKPQPAFLLYVNGKERQGEEKMGQEVGTMLETDIPQFLIELGRTVADSGMDFFRWSQENPDGIFRMAEKYI